VDPVDDGDAYDIGRGSDVFYAYPDHFPGMLRFNPAAGMEVALRSRIQSFGGWMGDDALLSEGDLMQETGFRLRRARFGLEGSLLSPVTFQLELDLFDHERTGGPLYEAWVDMTPLAFVGARFGVQKVPYSQGENMSSALMPHLDRALAVRSMSPPQAMGLVLHSEFWPEHGRLAVGVFNGIQRRPTFLQGWEGIGQSLGNRLERTLYALKLEVEPLEPVGPELADLYSVHSFRLGLGVGALYNDGRSIRTAGLSGYLHIKAWGFHLFSEMLAETNDPQQAPTSSDNVMAGEQSRMAQHTEVGYMVLPQRLGVSVRFEWLDSHTDREDQGDELVFTGTLTYYAVRDQLKAMLEATHREELHGAAIANNAILGGLQLQF